MGKKLTQEEAINNILKVRNDVDVSQLIYVNNRTPLQLVCIKHNIAYKQKYNGVCAGKRGCGFCLEEHVKNNPLTGKRALYKRKAKFEKDVLEKGLNTNKEIFFDTYKGQKTPINCLCKIHNNHYFQTPDNILQGKNGCSFCKKDTAIINYKKPIEEFIKESNIIHNNYYKYHDTCYNNLHDLIVIECPEHGHFKQRANNHIRGHGCKKCNSSGATAWNLENFTKVCKKKEKSGILYVIKCWNEKEEFYKVGITSRTIKQRFSNFPYNYIILQEITSIPENVYNIEKILKKNLKEFKYTPSVKFGGSTHECFKF